jgi:hypothetical protein
VLRAARACGWPASQRPDSAISHHDAVGVSDDMLSVLVTHRAPDPPIGTLRPMTVRLVADIQNRMFCAGSGCGYPRDEGDRIRPLC